MGQGRDRHLHVARQRLGAAGRMGVVRARLGDNAACHGRLVRQRPCRPAGRARSRCHGGDDARLGHPGGARRPSRADPRRRPAGDVVDRCVSPDGDRDRPAVGSRRRSLGHGLAVGPCRPRQHDRGDRRGRDHDRSARHDVRRAALSTGRVRRADRPRRVVDDAIVADLPRRSVGAAGVVGERAAVVPWHRPQADPPHCRVDRVEAGDRRQPRRGGEPDRTSIR